MYFLSKLISMWKLSSSVFHHIKINKLKSTVWKLLDYITSLTFWFSLIVSHLIYLLDPNKTDFKTALLPNVCLNHQRKCAKSTLSILLCRHNQLGFFCEMVNGTKTSCFGMLDLCLNINNIYILVFSLITKLLKNTFFLNCKAKESVRNQKLDLLHKPQGSKIE